MATAPGVLYRLAGRQPDPNVSDEVLADRIRSSIGPLEKQLDVPRVHVMVTDHIALLHGDVTKTWQADAIEHAVLRISGVDGVESHLHVGLIRGDTRPSHAHMEPPPPSDAWRTLVDTAIEAGASEAELAVHAVLCRFVARLPERAREHVVAHLPLDVRALVGSTRVQGRDPKTFRTVDELARAAAEYGGIAPEFAEAFTRRMLAVFRTIVSDEADDVAAVLPSDLRAAWIAEPVG
jgi:uncharacterized protein (DUF2267 family)